MPGKINIEKIKKELDKGTLIEMAEVYHELKAYLNQKFTEASQKLSEQAEYLESFKEKL